jgi:hypothetical protein
MDTGALCLLNLRNDLLLAAFGMALCSLVPNLLQRERRKPLAPEVKPDETELVFRWVDPGPNGEASR